MKCKKISTYGLSHNKIEIFANTLLHKIQENLDIGNVELVIANMFNEKNLQSQFESNNGIVDWQYECNITYGTASYYVYPNYTQIVVYVLGITTNNNDLKKFIHDFTRTVIHELRHAWQNTTNFPAIYDVPWKEKPQEIDAIKYSKQQMKKRYIKKYIKQFIKKHN